MCAQSIWQKKVAGSLRPLIVLKLLHKDHMMTAGNTQHLTQTRIHRHRRHIIKSDHRLVRSPEHGTCSFPSLTVDFRCIRAAGVKSQPSMLPQHLGSHQSTTSLKTHEPFSPLFSKWLLEQNAADLMSLWARRLNYVWTPWYDIIQETPLEKFTSLMFPDVCWCC